MFSKVLKKEAGRKGLASLFRRIMRRAPSMPRLALELSFRKAKALGFKQNKALTIDFLESAIVPSDAYDGREIKDSETLSLLIKHLVKKADSGTAGALLIIPEEMVFSRIIQLKTGEVRPLEKAVLEALPLPVEDVALETKEIVPLSRQITHKDINLWAAEKEYLTSLKDIFESSGVQILDFLPESLAIVSTLFPKMETADACLILVPQEEKTMMLIFAGRAVHFSNILPSLQSASYTPQSEKEFVGTVREAIAFYRDKVLHEHGASSEVNKILVIGSLAKELESRLSLNTQLKIEHPDILEQFHFSKEDLKKITFESRAEFSCLLGAARWLNKSTK
jgi:hypothetical protein